MAEPIVLDVIATAFAFARAEHAGIENPRARRMPELET